MSYNGSGTFNINSAGQPVVTGTVISTTAFNALTADLGTGLSTAITKDGQTVATARIPFAAGINSSLVTDATSTTTGSIITAGGVGIAKALFVGTTANIAGTTTLAGVTATSITDSGLTSGRVTYAGTAGLLQDSANLLYSGTDLTVYGVTVGRGGGAVSTNTAVGASALFSNTGSKNTAVGYQSLYSHNAGGNTNNTAIGTSSLYSNTSGTQNAAVGNNALYSNTTASNNAAVGEGSLYYNTTGASNSALGQGALQNNTTASNNTAVGFQAGYSATTGNDSVLIGYKAGFGITTSANNICIGSGSGTYTTSIVTGAQNIHIGAYTTASSSSASYEIVVGYTAAGKGANTGFINPNSGGVYQGNNSSSWSTTSDQRLKKNIADNNDGLNKINSIRVRNFEYRIEEEIIELPTHAAIKKDGVQLGVIAQELQAVLPECVKQESTGVLSVDTDNLTWYLINAVKQLSAEVKSLKSQLKGA